MSSSESEGRLRQMSCANIACTREATHIVWLSFGSYGTGDCRLFTCKPHADEMTGRLSPRTFQIKYATPISHTLVGDYDV